MRKEVVWAIFAGILLGLIVAGGVWRINSSISRPKKVTINTVVSPSPSAIPSNPTELKIVLNKPSDDIVIIENKITVSGLTKALTWVTISGENSDYIIQSDSSGSFTQDVDLIPGVNKIKATATNKEGENSEANITVVYSSSFQLKTAEMQKSPTDSSESSTIKQKVAQDLTNTVNQPKAYIGTVTDITDSTIEIKTKTSDIQQIAISVTNTNVLNTTGTINKQVKTTDIAIGDFIVAMGYVGANSVLDAQRILVTGPPTSIKLSIFEAKVKTIAKKTLSVVRVEGNKDDLLTPDTKTSISSYKDSKTTGIKLSLIAVDDLLIYVTNTDDKGVVTIRSIFTIPQN